MMTKHDNQPTTDRVNICNLPLEGWKAEFYNQFSGADVSFAQQCQCCFVELIFGALFISSTHFQFVHNQIFLPEIHILGMGIKRENN